MDQAEFDKLIIQFFKERPSIAVALLEIEGNFPTTTISKVLPGDRSFPKKHQAKMLELMKKYGWYIEGKAMLVR